VTLTGLAQQDLVSDGIGTSQLVRAGVVVVVSLIAAVAVRRLLIRALDRGDTDRYAGRLTGRFVSVLVVVVGLVYALNVAGVRVGPLLGALGVGGIALAFALQDVLQNFTAGLLLQVRRPFRVGDQIQSGDYEGRVDDVNLRTVEMTTFDGLTVYLPNAEVLKAPIVNYTRTPLSRTTLAVGLAYDTHLPQARAVLLAACTRADGVSQEPPAEVWVERFGDSSIELAVRYWHAADIASRWQARSALAVSVKAALDEAGMVIPFPQRTLWFGPGSTTLALGESPGTAERR